MQRKKECEARAMKIVEFLIEGKLRKEAFFECVRTSVCIFNIRILEHRRIAE